MAKLTFQIDDIVAEYEFPTDAPVLEFVHMFNQRLGTPDASDVDQVQECLYWLADHLYGTAKQQYIEQERAKAITEAESRYEFRRPARREDTNGTEPGKLEGGTKPGARASRIVATAD